MLDHTKFDQLCEQAITNTTKMFYPRNLKFSEKFLQAFKEEYRAQKKTVTEEKGDKAFGSHFERMLKGLRFEAKKIEDEGKPKAKQKPKLVEAKKEKGSDPMGDLRSRNPVTGGVIDDDARLQKFGRSVSNEMRHWYGIDIKPHAAVKLAGNYFKDYKKMGLDTYLREQIADELAFIATGKGWPAIADRWSEEEMTEFVNEINSTLNGPTMSQYSKLRR